MKVTDHPHKPTPAKNDHVARAWAGLKYVLRARPLWVTGCLSLALLSFGGCDQNEKSPPVPQVQAQETSASPSPSAGPTYSLDDREAFLATGPSCDEFKAWYAQFPVDADGLTALRYIQACREAPPPVLGGDVFAGSNERMIRALLSPGISGPSREAARSAIAKGVCGMFSDGDKSLWLVGSQVRDYGGTAADYRGVLDAAVEHCPSNEDDLRLFGHQDVLRSTDQFTNALRAAGADLSAFGADPDDKVAALAAVVCQTSRDGGSVDNGFFLSTVLGVSEAAGNQLADQSRRIYCPQY